MPWSGGLPFDTMKRFVCFLGLHVAFLTRLTLTAHAAISVGPGGSGTILFNTLPSPTEWSTMTNGGGGGDIADAAGLDTAVGTN